MTRPELLLENFGAEKSSGKVEKQLGRRQPEQLGQGHRTHEREVVTEHLNPVAPLSDWKLVLYEKAIENITLYGEKSKAALMRKYWIFFGTK